jgi:hypothetical protein
MSMSPRQEIDHRSLKLMVALIAFFLASATAFLAAGSIDSISGSYGHGGPSRDIFVGSMFAIAAFMAAYNGYSGTEAVLAKVVALSALGVALFPGGSGTDSKLIDSIHTVASLVMFSALVALCRVFYRRAKGKGLPGASRRAWLYAVCAAVMLIAMVLVVVDHFLGRPLQAAIPRLVFHCEHIALIAFGVAWLAASHVLPWITAPQEQWLWYWGKNERTID